MAKEEGFSFAYFKRRSICICFFIQVVLDFKLLRDISVANFLFILICFSRLQYKLFIFKFLASFNLSKFSVIYFLFIIEEFK